MKILVFLQFLDCCMTNENSKKWGKTGKFHYEISKGLNVNLVKIRWQTTLRSELFSHTLFLYFWFLCCVLFSQPVNDALKFQIFLAFWNSNFESGFVNQIWVDFRKLYIWWIAVQKNSWSTESLPDIMYFALIH